MTKANKITRQIGVDISTSSIKMVELSPRPTGQGYVLEQYAIEPLPKDAVTDYGVINSLDAVADAIRTAWKRLGTQNTNIRLALHDSAVIVKNISIQSGLSEESLEAEVEKDAKQYIPFAPENVYLDFAVIGPAPDNADKLEVIVVSTSKILTDEYVAAAELAGLTAVSVGVQTFAVQAAFEQISSQLPDVAAGQCVALVDISTNMLRLNVLRDGQSIYVREQEIADYPDNYEATELALYINKVAKEVDRALNMFICSTQFDEVGYVVLTGELASLSGLADAVATRIPSKEDAVAEVDPLAEADLFLTFGRDQQAEEVLKEALTREPSNNPVKLKLLSIYTERKEIQLFNRYALEIKASVDDVAWGIAAAMGRVLDPTNPMYRDVADISAEAKNKPVDLYGKDKATAQEWVNVIVLEKDIIIANPFAQMTSSSRVNQAQLQKDCPALMIACGLALSRSERLPHIEFNFLPHRAPLTAERIELGLTCERAELRSWFAGKKNFTPTPMQIERGLTDEDSSVRSAFANRTDFAITPMQLERGLTDKDISVRMAFAERTDFTPTPDQIERGLVDVDGKVNEIIIDAYKMGASDIHIESGAGRANTLIRLRINGSMIKHLEVPWTSRDVLVNRIKYMCDLDTAEKRKPQVGRIKFHNFAPLNIDLRATVLPVQGGVENVTLRMLPSGEPIPLDIMGFTAHNLPLLKRTISLPYGLFIVCGPTGSGKLTTLHSILKYINTPDTEIWTVEDPVEFAHKGLHQVQVDKKAGVDFATAMQAVLSSDPDVIMVSEAGDKEVVSTIIDVSLHQGQMVFATTRANSAPEAIRRLLELDINVLNFSDAFHGVLAQRLAKRLCRECKKPHIATTEELKVLLTEYASELQSTESWKKDPNASFKALFTEWIKLFGDEKGNITLYEKVGCEKCSGTGYRGRIGLHELLISTPALKDGILENATLGKLFQISLEEGMRTFKQDGIEKVLSGVTDMHQVRAVCAK